MGADGLSRRDFYCSAQGISDQKGHDSGADQRTLDAKAVRAGGFADVGIQLDGIFMAQRTFALADVCRRLDVRAGFVCHPMAGDRGVGQVLEFACGNSGRSSVCAKRPVSMGAPPDLFVHDPGIGHGPANTQCVLFAMGHPVVVFARALDALAHRRSGAGGKVRRGVSSLPANDSCNYSL